MYPTLRATLVAALCILPLAACERNAAGEDPATTQDAAADTASEDVAGEDGAGEDRGETDVAAVDAASDVSPTCDRTERVVSLETTDGVTLAADYRPGAAPDAPAIVLLHMIPPSWDRTSYPPRVRQALAATGAAVLNVDRRGAGASTGEPRDAYEGAGGRLDVEAAVRFLLADEACPVDAARLMVVGASNGTTSALDYAVGHDASLPTPARVAWLSPGTYTENQTTIEAHREALDALPLLIVRPDDEPWSERFDDATPAAWSIVTVPDGAHGTQNFDDGAREAVQLPALVDWAAAL